MLALAALWGFAEATLFFLVSDIVVGIAAVRSGLRPAIAAAFAVALAAALGGLVMYLWAGSNPAAARAALAALPAIDAAMIARTGEAFATGGYAAMLAGAFSGIPYKIYAVLAGEAGRPLALFLVLTPLVRLPRLLLMALTVAAIGRLLRPRLSAGARLAVLGAAWVLFYAFYFAVMP